MPIPRPEKIGRFTIESHLGSGGMGEVYRAFDPTLHRTVAIKTVRTDLHNPDGAYLQRLYREAQAIARLQHPNIVTVFEAAEADGLVYIAMEYLKGENLGAAIARGDLTFEERIAIISHILDALNYAHSEGVIHRDIKPGNVHRLPGGSIKLLDFGLARVVLADSLTATGMAMGTPFYASPEQLMGEEVDGRTDVYATGALAYELLTGRRPFDGETLSAVIYKVITDPPPPLGTDLSASFPELDRILARAMAKNRTDRYATADDMRPDLAAFMVTAQKAPKLPTHATPSAPLQTVVSRTAQRRRRRGVERTDAAGRAVLRFRNRLRRLRARPRALWIGLAAAGLVLAVGLTWTFLSRTPEPAAPTAAAAVIRLRRRRASGGRSAGHAGRLTRVFVARGPSAGRATRKCAGSAGSSAGDRICRGRTGSNAVRSTGSSGERKRQREETVRRYRHARARSSDTASSVRRLTAAKAKSIPPARRSIPATRSGSRSNRTATAICIWCKRVRAGNGPCSFRTPTSTAA
jgi:serine/threonine-protein kinase